MLNRLLGTLTRFEVKNAARQIFDGRHTRLLHASKWFQAEKKENKITLDQRILVPRPPVVTIMGHVDHGKTTLLDHLRNSRIVEGEFGGITQHIGAFVVPFKHEGSSDVDLVTFLDTPGHAAFSSMRERGANVTDIVVLVIACEDGLMDQSIESINHAKKAQVPIIVAVNKIDRYDDPKLLEKSIKAIREQLIVNDVATEPDGGEVQLVKMSALKGIGVDKLKDCILALAETLQLKADINCPVDGRVIESQIDPHRGKLTTILVQNGVLRKGHYLVGGQNNWARVRALFDERGKLCQDCGPGTPVQVTGWRENELPEAGDIIHQVPNEFEAKMLIQKFKQERSNQKAEEDAKLANMRAEEHIKFYREKMHEKREAGYKYGTLNRYLHGRGYRVKESQDDELADRKVNMILKCDVNGTLEALLGIFDTYDRDGKQPVKLDIMHYGVGNITENDYKLATSFKNSVIYGFNVKTDNQKMVVQARKDGTEIRLYNVIYHLIDDFKARVAEKIPEREVEVEMGKARVLEEFVVKERGIKKLHVAGSRCEQGPLNHNYLFKLTRNNEIIAKDMKVFTLRHLKEDVKEIEKNKEFGISFKEHPSLQFKPGDWLIAYERQKFKPQLKWDLKGFS